MDSRFCTGVPKNLKPSRKIPFRNAPSMIPVHASFRRTGDILKAWLAYNSIEFVGNV